MYIKITQVLSIDFKIKEIFPNSYYKNELKPRFKNSLELINSIKKRYNKCWFKTLLNFHCPKQIVQIDPDIHETICYHSSINHVYLFLKNVLRRIVPFKVFGTRENLSNFLKSFLT